MLYIEDLDIEIGGFEKVETLKEIKEILKSGEGVIVSPDSRKGICYVERRCQLFLLECTDKDDILEIAKVDDILVKEIDIEEAEKLIEGYLKLVKNEEEKRREYDDWFSKS